MIEGILFDLDGTLVDSLPLIEYSFRRVFEDMELPWESGKVMETVGLPLHEVARNYAGVREESFLKLYLEHQLKKHDEYIKLFPGTREMLEQVRNWGLKAGVVTSKRRVMAERALRLLSIEHMIDGMIALEDCGKHKPDPLPVTTALEKLGMSPLKAVFAGDSWYDIESGKAAGVITVGVTWGMADRLKLSGSSPDFIVDRWDEFLMFIKGKIV